MSDGEVQQICRAHPMTTFLVMEINKIGPPTPQFIQMFPRTPADGFGCGEYDPGEEDEEDGETTISSGT